jgi:hypothetical protein
MDTIENLRFDNAEVTFGDKKFDVGMFFREADTYALSCLG